MLIHSFSTLFRVCAEISNQYHNTLLPAWFYVKNRLIFFEKGSVSSWIYIIIDLGRLYHVWYVLYDLVFLVPCRCKLNINPKIDFSHRKANLSWRECWLFVIQYHHQNSACESMPITARRSVQLVILFWDQRGRRSSWPRLHVARHSLHASKDPDPYLSTTPG